MVKGRSWHGIVPGWGELFHGRGVWSHSGLGVILLLRGMASFWAVGVVLWLIGMATFQAGRIVPWSRGMAGETWQWVVNRCQGAWPGWAGLLVRGDGEGVGMAYFCCSRSLLSPRLCDVVAIWGVVAPQGHGDVAVGSLVEGAGVEGAGVEVATVVVVVVVTGVEAMGCHCMCCRRGVMWVVMGKGRRTALLL